jgi:nicotinamide mononucleotide transporter
MQEAPQFLLSLLASLSIWEGCAVILATAYLLLAVRENILCWYCALLSTAIFTFLFWDVSLLMESALNVYYMMMAVYGWYQWKYGGNKKSRLTIRRLTIKQNGLIIIFILIMSLLSGYFLDEHTHAVWPYIDSFTTWASVITTFMVAKKILENWLYWLVIDSISIPLYIDRGLHLTAILFMMYIVIVIFGFISWRKRFTQQELLTAHAG